MKSIFCTIVLSSLLVLVSGCSDHSTSTQGQELSDGQILNIMMTVDEGEIAASQEAAKKEVSIPVGIYAKYLILQHQNNLEELTQLSKQLKLEPEKSAISESLVAGGEHDHKAWSDLQGKAFDKAFIDAMVKGHQAGLELINSKLLPQSKSPELKASVGQFREMVSQHLEKAIAIQKTL